MEPLFSSEWHLYQEQILKDHVKKEKKTGVRERASRVEKVYWVFFGFTFILGKTAL